MFPSGNQKSLLVLIFGVNNQRKTSFKHYEIFEEQKAIVKKDQEWKKNAAEPTGKNTCRYGFLGKFKIGHVYFRDLTDKLQYYVASIGR